MTLLRLRWPNRIARKNFKDDSGASVASRREQADPRTGHFLVKDGLGYLTMAAHSDPRGGLSRLTVEPTRFFAITWGGAMDEHHRVEATYLRLFETVGNGLGLLQRGLKMVFSGFPLMCRRSGHTRDRMREAKDRPKRYCAGIDQLASKRIKLLSLRMLAKD